ncbi:uncharacterized protein ACLA_074180 [Aspergillus clavatus NRRL 1]|uniref:Methyltransferase type 11 domain-containing protein n=1 Tax=Aspergillus clavatus (strain ATCC 1007 / CBS 513.65 / DSM 816 / NCTC 3887 / NRRL 1 / QM 1276 / 107) TaxID=344612 RepID=A1C7L0_ASPCL|nr:uncharacterized protein ACLA_074180 [Aspergillus clavatus NRRL 1]EAW14381.1 conserved hypothetical protein [Aspergillus clavatus NRRL 1]
MADSIRASTRCPPPRQGRGTPLDTIVEDVREGQYSEKLDHHTGRVEPTTPTPRLKLQTSGLSESFASRLNRLRSPISAGTVSSCSDTEWQRQMQNLDDLYDVTDDDSDFSDECTSFSSSRPTSLTTPMTRNSLMSPASRNRYPSLTIPSSNTWPSLHNAPKSSPIPPTPPPKIPVSPAALSKLARCVPALNAPPSLDGSVSSDQISSSSEPATPDMQSLPDIDWDAQDFHVRPDEVGSQPADLPAVEIGETDMQSIEIAFETTDEDWRHVLGNFPSIPGQPSLPSDDGVFLPEDALAILRHIPLNSTPEPWSETTDQNDEMWQLEVPVQRPRSADDATPASALSGYSFSGLSIPSPGGFFASLGPRARHTWSFPRTAKPPSSAIAEGFYNLPFSRDNREIVEQIIECPEPLTEEQLTAVYAPEGPLTAIKIPPEESSVPFEYRGSPVSPGPEGVYEISRPATWCENQDHDENYEEELKKKAVASLDRTSVWLAAQESYLAALRETNPVNMEDEADSDVEAVLDDTEQGSPEMGPRKNVRFAETVPGAPRPPSALASRDSIYWRGFQSVRGRSDSRDSFIHRNTRFDAVQSIRLGLAGMHANCLSGNYELVRPERPPYKGPFSQAPRNSVLTSVLAEKAQFSILEKEQLVLSQIRAPMWAMDALRYLNGGCLVTSPARKRLSMAAAPTNSPKAKGRRVRILDLGGHASCEWAWQLAHDYPNATVYTVFTEHQAVNQGIKGPSNHRQVPVSQLWKLPFADNKFDLISARSLPALLKNERPVGENQDEYDLCLQECRRCLKPGGYLEFFVMDAEISRAGPYASAASIEFAFNLKTRGYDPLPTKSFMPRLLKGGFVGVKRAWMFLPMGVEPVKAEMLRETPDPRVKSLIEDCEAVHGPVGSTADIASVTGLLGGWMWEQWLLKLQVEMGREQYRLLEGIGSVFDEGRKNGAGWTCLSGWAMKPRGKRLPKAVERNNTFA